ncbi:MAG: sigma-E factor negative regulatory protein [Nitrosospira sp.]|nr:sigma-E factor negative regulatory protein [Nitrosospira sp.]
MKEEISALMDGELNPDAAADVIAQLYKTDGLRDEWMVYHLISDALGQPGVMPTAITRRVSARLATEPTALAPRPPIRHKPGVFAAAASVAAVAVIGWMSLQTTDRRVENPASNNLASQTPPFCKQRPPLFPFQRQRPPLLKLTIICSHMANFRPVQRCMA